MMNNHTHHNKNLPALAGIATFRGAMKPGLSVAECVRRLKRLHYSFTRLRQIFNDRLTAEPLYELKMAFSLHAHLCAEHATALRTRVTEMREPPLGLDEVPDDNLELFFDEIIAAPDTAALALGLYEIALPKLKESLEQHLIDTNPLVDHPSVRVIRFALLELEDMLDYGSKAVAQLVTRKERSREEDWLLLLRDCLTVAGGLHGTNKSTEKVLEPIYSAKPRKYDGIPRRDQRFTDPYNMGVNAEVFIYDEQIPPEPKTLMMFYKRFREIDVPEMMSSILAETPDQPWNYYRDMTRQLWDEARHSMMGEVGFLNLGVDWPSHVMINFNWSLVLNSQLTPRERHAVLYFIEQGLMSKSGKRFEWEVGLASNNPLAALFQDYDWADEVLHSRIGRDWYLKDFENPKEGVDYGDRCWSRVMMDWNKWREEGKTQHHNWWPGLYRAACRQWKIEPDPKILAFKESYESVRADLKVVSASG